jgi:aspartyl/glutamyl-tRNA(Asn/Gln) amidotransferase C subunit
MAPTREEVRAMARLARLEFTTDELDRMAADLRGILEHVDALRQAVAAAEGDDGQRQLRADVPGADPLSMPPGYSAPEWRDGFFTVPRLPAHRDDG